MKQTKKKILKKMKVDNNELDIVSNLINDRDTTHVSPIINTEVVDSRDKPDNITVTGVILLAIFTTILIINQVTVNYKIKIFTTLLMLTLFGIVVILLEIRRDKK
jgi:hypothetical protein